MHENCRWNQFILLSYYALSHPRLPGLFQSGVGLEISEMRIRQPQRTAALDCDANSSKRPFYEDNLCNMGAYSPFAVL
jgi:hypothetical protein